MTPKDKAQELVTKFKGYVYPFMSGSGYLTGSIDNDVVLENSKKCANICVDEILKSLPCKAVVRRKYWYEVKTELNNLNK